jgi:hypothetical protein
MHRLLVHFAWPRICENLYYIQNVWSLFPFLFSTVPSSLLAKLKAVVRAIAHAFDSPLLLKLSPGTIYCQLKEDFEFSQQTFGLTNVTSPQNLAIVFMGTQREKFMGLEGGFMGSIMGDEISEHSSACHKKKL